MSDGHRRLLQLVGALLAEDPPAKLIDFQGNVALLQLAHGPVAVVIAPTLRGEALAERMRELLQLDPRTPVEFVLVSGGDDMHDVLASVQPSVMVRRMVRAFHWGPDGAIWCGRKSTLQSPLGRVLARVAEREAEMPVPDPDALVQSLPPPPPVEDRELLAEHRAFILAFSKRRPWATWIGLAIVIAVFGLEMWWGGSEFPPTLWRMGANAGVSLWDEPWRLLSHALLHGGVAHVALNGFVLLVLGPFMERVLGWSRFVLACFAGAIVGGIASAWQMGPMSVGASGAIWALLGVALGITLRPGTLLPRALLKSLRRTALINLALNLGVSFLPQVDMMAHLGGGAIGLALAWSGILTRGARGLIEAEDPAEPPPERVSVRIVGGAAVALWLGCLGFAVATGRPWLVVQEPAMRTETVPGTAMELEVPEPSESSEILVDGPLQGIVFGGLETVPVVVAVNHRPSDGRLVTADDLRREVESEEADEVAAGAEVLEPLRVRDDVRWPALEQRIAAPEGFVVTRLYLLRPEGVVIIEIARWPEIPAAWDGVEAQVLASAAR